MLLLWYYYTVWSQLIGAITTLKESKTGFNRLEISYLKHIRATHSLPRWNPSLLHPQTKSQNVKGSRKPCTHTLFYIQGNKGPRKALTDNSPFLLKSFFFQEEDLRKTWLKISLEGEKFQIHHIILPEKKNHNLKSDAQEASYKTQQLFLTLKPVICEG